MGNFKSKIKSTIIYKALKVAKRQCKDIIADCKTISYFRKKNKENKNILNKQNQKIKVAFLCQYIPAWNKFEPIYKMMKADDRFEPYIVCVPSQMENYKLIDSKLKDNDTYDYFIEEGYTTSDVVNALVGEDRWYDLKGLKCSYVFYTRPYNYYMPKAYTSEVVREYAKICSLIYGMNMTKDIFNVTMNTDFYKDVYIYYAETKSAMKMYKRKFPITSLLGWRKVYFYGLPAFEQILNDKDDKSTSWDFSKNEFRVMWTPRWTTDPKLGGTNFFLYYKGLLDYATKNKDVDFLFRPHPLTFDNFIKTGEMTKNEVDEYVSSIEGMENVSLDREKEYDGTMWNSSVLISDISGFMPEYFVTGKPIIYCASNMILTLAEHTKELLKGCYISYTQEETYRYLGQFKEGHDPLKEKRKEIVAELFGDNLNNSTSRIVESLYFLHTD